MLAHPRIRRALIWRLIANPQHRASLIHEIAMHDTYGEAGFESAPLDSLSAIEGFEDCYWLFSSNELNLGISQLRFDEAASLYRTVCQWGEPAVVELGRYKGGTTFLLAAAGARVRAIENDPSVERQFRPSLARALRHFGLDDRVRLETGNAYTCAIDGESCDLVLVHCAPQTGEQIRTLVDRWWAAIRPGGGMILHATPHLPAVVAAVETLEAHPDRLGALRDDSLAGEHVLFRKPADPRGTPAQGT
jgi:hypothetical protein